MRHVKNYHMVTDQSMTSSSNSAAQDVGLYQGYAIQAVWTGTPTGTLKLQATVNGTDWSDIAGTSTSLTGSASSWLWNVTDILYESVRLVYTASSGTGTLNAYISKKGWPSNG